MSKRITKKDLPRFIQNIAIEYEGTIEEKRDKSLPSIRKEAIAVIPKLKQAGYNLFLWTSREGDELEDALNMLASKDLLKYFSAAATTNHSLLNVSRKLNADLYIDAKNSIDGDVDWLQIEKDLVKEV